MSAATDFDSQIYKVSWASSSTPTANSSSEVDKTAKKVKDKTGPSFWWAIAGTVALVGAIEFVCHILEVKDDTDPNKDYELTGSY